MQRNFLFVYQMNDDEDNDAYKVKVNIMRKNKKVREKKNTDVKRFGCTL